MSFHCQPIAILGFCSVMHLSVFAVADDASSPGIQPRRAFPSGQGFGALATGGRGGETYHVTNLNDAGPGSFRDAVSREHRIVLFDVGGVIRLAANVPVSSHITLAGQSAPGDGIALYGHSVSFSGARNVIVRYLRFREGIGGDRGKCAVNISGGSDMIFDHVSIQWGRWDCLGVTQGSHDITFQYCLIGEGLDPQRFGALVDSVTNVTFSHNLWINNQSRNPKAKGTIQYINNVVYNWGVSGLVGGHSAAAHQLDALGNYFIKGPSSNERFLSLFTATDHVFQEGNFADLDRDGRLNGRPVVEADFGEGDAKPTFATRHFLNPLVPVIVEPAPAAYERVVAGAGCSQHRDSVDARLIAHLTSLGKTGNIVRNEAEAGGIRELKTGKIPVSTTGDGIPDDWKRAHGIPLGTPSAPGRDVDSSLEDYLNELAGDGSAK